jgi:hypothetical protein
MEKIKSYLKSNLLLFIFSLIVSCLCYIISVNQEINTNAGVEAQSKEGIIGLHKVKATNAQPRHSS